MSTHAWFKDTIFSIQTDAAFERAALHTFLNQTQHNALYAEFVKHLGIDPRQINTLTDIPFLPISFFKTHQVKTGDFKEQITFTSSGTTGQTPSQHAVRDLSIYETSFNQAFKMYCGQPESYCILALLPAYLERTGSSLVYMADKLIEKSNHPSSGFYLNNLDQLVIKLNQLANTNTKTLLLGVSFALLDLAEKLPSNFTHGNLMVMETGGMKGRRKEMIREELHQVLQSHFHTQTIHSEYGMTELLSQAYATTKGLYQAPPWMRVLTRDTSDPLKIIGHEKTGGINIIDLANQDSCAFLATEDLGKTHTNGTFEVLGRFDTAEIRGCNLMAL